jgi:hypothetical protein
MLCGENLGRFGSPAALSFQQKVPPTRLDDLMLVGAADSLGTLNHGDPPDV